MPQAVVTTYASCSLSNIYYGNCFCWGYDIARKLSLIGYSGPLAVHNTGNIVELFSMDWSITSWKDLQKASSLRKLSINGDSGI
jgi:hypothetical protein